MYNSRVKSRKLEISFSKRFLFLGRNSGIHGLGHLFKNGAPFFARLFWILVLLVSVGCSYWLLMPVVARGHEVGYTADTLYLDWTTTFPAVTVCETFEKKAARNKVKQLLPDLIKGKSFDFMDYIASLVYNRATSCHKNICEACDIKVPCDFPWRETIDTIHLSCEELIQDCSIMGEKFDCCKRFHQVDSEYGPCYSFNTLQAEDSREPLYSVNRSTGPGRISFRVTNEAQISVHSTEDLSTNYLDPKLKFSVRPMLRQDNFVQYTFSVVDFDNDALLEDNDPVERGCRYLHELPEGAFDTYSVYSYGACRLAKYTEHLYEHCRCVNPVRDISYEKKFCNFTGLSCIVEYEEIRTKSGLQDDHDEENSCLPSCMESELTTIHISRRWVTEESFVGTKVVIQMASLPTVRFNRYLRRSELDLVVSVGGMVGLFFGASILSLLEIFYLFLRK